MPRTSARLKRSLLSVATMALVVAGVTAVDGTPAAAASWIQTGCDHAGAFSWYSKHLSDNTWSQIDIFNGSGCGGYSILVANVQDMTNGTYHLTMADEACDAVGGQLRLHLQGTAQEVLNSGGCSVDYTEASVKYTSVGSPRNFWVYIHATTNTDAYALPIPV